MAYSFTEKKRIRKDFGKRSSILEVPYLLAIQLDSYRKFLQADTPRRRDEGGTARCVQERVPDHQLLRQRDARVRQLPPRRSGVRRQGMPAPRPHLRRAAARERAPGRLRQGSLGDQEDGQGHPRAGGLPRRDAADDRQRHVRRQRHRARHRLAAAPLARACSSITTAARRTARASCCSPRASFLTAARGSTSSSTRRTACSRASTAAASCRSRSSCARSATPTSRCSTCSSTRTRSTSRRTRRRARARAGAPARRDRDVRHQDRRQGHRREGRRITARHVRSSSSQASRARRADEYLDRQDPRARRRQHRDRRDPRQGQRRADDDHRREAHRRPASTKIEHAVRERPRPRPVHLRTRCASTRPRTASRRWSRSTA